jgi:HK97 family phage major capsid protein
LIDQLGIRVLDGLQANILLNYSNGHDAAFASETLALSESTRSETGDTLSARRVGGWKKYSNEYLAQSVVFPVIVAEMNSAIERAVSKALFDQILANEANVGVSGYGSSDSLSAATYSVIHKNPAAVEVDAFDAARFVMTKALYHKLVTTAKFSGGGQGIVMDGMVDGIPSFGTSLIGYSDTGSTKSQLIFGDFAGGATIGYYSGIELILDPYTSAANGITQVTFNRLADISHDPYRMSVMRNLQA